MSIDTQLWGICCGSRDQNYQEVGPGNGVYCNSCRSLADYEFRYCVNGSKAGDACDPNNCRFDSKSEPNSNSKICRESSFYVNDVSYNNSTLPLIIDNNQNQNYQVSYQHFINYTTYTDGWPAACPFFGCQIYLTNGTETSMHGISISQEGNLKINRSCDTIQCTNGFNIYTKITCSINYSYNKTKYVLISSTGTKCPLPSQYQIKSSIIDLYFLQGKGIITRTFYDTLYFSNNLPCLYQKCELVLYDSQSSRCLSISQTIISGSLSVELTNTLVYSQPSWIISINTQNIINSKFCFRCVLSSSDSIYNGPFNLVIDQESKLIYTKFTIQDINYTYNPQSTQPYIKYQNWTEYLYQMSNDTFVSQFLLFNHTSNKYENNSTFVKIDQTTGQLSILSNILNGYKQISMKFITNTSVTLQSNVFKVNFKVDPEKYCLTDQISLNTKNPTIQSQFFQKINGIPVLVVNKQVNSISSLQVDLSSRLVNKCNPYCILQGYQISKVIGSQTNQVIPSSIYSQLFSLSSRGLFKITSFNKQYSDIYLVYIQANNGYNVVGNDSQYVAQIYFYQIAPSFSAAPPSKLTLYTSNQTQPQFYQIYNFFPSIKSSGQQNISLEFFPNMQFIQFIKNGSNFNVQINQQLITDSMVGSQIMNYYLNDNTYNKQSSQMTLQILIIQSKIEVDNKSTASQNQSSSSNQSSQTSSVSLPNNQSNSVTNTASTTTNQDEVNQQDSQSQSNQLQQPPNQQEIQTNQNQIQQSTSVYSQQQQKSLKLKLQKQKKVIITSYFSGVIVKNNSALQNTSAVQIPQQMNIISTTLKSISSFGLVTIQFSEQMDQNIDQSLFSQQNIQIYIVPAQNRDQDSDFDPSSITFNWTVKSFDGINLQIQIQFLNPLMISPLQEQDMMYIDISQVQDSFQALRTELSSQEISSFISSQKYSQQRRLTILKLKKDQSILYRRIPKQIVNNLAAQQAQSVASSIQSGMQYLFFAALALQLLGSSAIQKFTILCHALQIVLHLPMFSIIVQANVMMVFNIILPIAQCDFLGQFLSWTNVGFQFDPNDQADNIPSQTQDLGFSNYNSVLNLGSLPLFFMLYFLKLFTAIFTRVLYFSICKKNLMKRIVEYLEDGTYFRDIIGLYIDGYIDLIITSYFNQQFLFYTTNGAIFGIFFSYFILSTSLTLIPLLLIWISTKKEKHLRNKKFEKRWSVLYDGIKLNTPQRRLYFFIFIARRLIIINIVFFVTNYQAVQIQMLIVSNLLSCIYIGYTMALEKKIDNQIALFNEWSISILIQHMLFFTDFIQDDNQKYQFGWSMVFFLMQMILFNFIIIFYIAGRFLVLLAFKYYNLIDSKIKSRNLFGKQNMIDKSIDQQIRKIAISDIFQNENQIETVKKKEFIYYNQMNILDLQPQIENQQEEINKNQKKERLMMLKDRVLQHLIKKGKNYRKPPLDEIQELSSQSFISETATEKQNVFKLIEENEQIQNISSISQHDTQIQQNLHRFHPEISYDISETDNECQIQNVDSIDSISSHNNQSEVYIENQIVNYNSILYEEQKDNVIFHQIQQPMNNQIQKVVNKNSKIYKNKIDFLKNVLKNFEKQKSILGVYSQNNKSQRKYQK